MNCVLERAYDWFKQTAAASKLFFYGQRFRHYGAVRVFGTVANCAHEAADGDLCFDLLAEPGCSPARWHCEATSCQPPELRKEIAALCPGRKIFVSGTMTFDPPHHIGPRKYRGGEWEIHPVTGIEARGGPE